MTGTLGEFGRIASIFAPLIEGHAEALGLQDDAALLRPDLVVTTDTIVEGVDFLPADPPDLVARKLLRVNLSDLAAMGATPECYLLTTILPTRCDDAWVRSFAAGLAEDQAEYGIRLIGGDSGSTPGPITLSATLFGRAKPARTTRRSGAAPGDLIFVSGGIGDSALGLLVLTYQLSLDDKLAERSLAERYHLPQPRTALGQKLVGLASAMIDISDGLAADLGHLSSASGVSAIIESRSVPLSDAAAMAVAAAPDLLATILTGGDDYELLFTAPGDREAAIMAAAAASGVAVHRIGRIMADTGTPVTIFDGDGVPLILERTGWRHV